MAATNLTELLNESNQARDQIMEGISMYSSAIKDLDETFGQLDNLIHEVTTNSEKHELLQYKSSILQLKSDFLTQLETAKSSLTSLNKAIGLFEKAIQLNTGDIF